MASNTSPLYIVTGASAGIGHAVAHELLSRGTQVLCVARTVDPLSALEAEFPELATAVPADLSDPKGIELVSSSIEPDRLVAGVVHAAGSLVPLEPFEQLDPSELVDHFRIHVAAPIALYRALAANHAIERMLYIDSYSASSARMGWSAYSIVKSAAQMSARCAAQELSQTQTIRVFPGAVMTRIVDAVLASETETAKAFAAMIERGECVAPEQAARFIVGLVLNASDETLRSQSEWDFNNPDHRTDVLK